MRGKMRDSRVMVCILLLCFAGSSFSGFAQTTEEAEPVPYGEEEFPQWMKDLRRAEIIAVGSFPFSLFFANFGYDMIRFTANGFASEYAPWPFSGEGAPELSRGEKTGVLLAGVGISLTIALIDYILGRNKDDETDAPVPVQREEPAAAVSADEESTEQTLQNEDN